jgi:glycosyltransferase involved in cell wall biosynthesis
MRKVVHLTSVHPAYDVRIFHKECKSLAQAGYHVTFIVPHEQDEVIDGVYVKAVCKPTGRKGRVTRTVWQVYKEALQQNADVYHFHDPELILIGLLLRMKGKKVIYDIHEDVPRHILLKEYIPVISRRAVSKIAALIEWIAGQVFDSIVVVTPTIAQRFPTRKVLIIQNFPIWEELIMESPIPYRERDPVVAYVGGIATIRGINEIVQAMALIPKEVNARLVLAGAFTPKKLETEIQNVPGWSRVDFIGWQSRPQVAELLARARVGVVVLHPLPNYIDSQPIKLFEYMAAGLPVVASDFLLLRKIVDGAGCGLLVNPLDPTAIAEAIKWLLEHPDKAEAMGKRGQLAVRNHYNWEREEKKLVQLYQRISTRGRKS